MPNVQKTFVEVDGKKVPATVHIERRRGTRYYLGKRGAILRMSSRLLAGERRAEWERFSEWVKSKIAARADGEHAFGKTYRDGDELTVGQRTYQIRIESTSNKTHSAQMQGRGVIGVRLSEKATEAQREHAMRHLLSRVVAQDFLPDITRRVMELNHLYFQKKVNGVKLKYNRSNWGSCSAKGNINLSTCLLFAPDEVVDYVIIHELAHLIEMNHSSRFWALVEKAMPDYPLKKKWLRDNWQKCNF